MKKVLIIVIVLLILISCSTGPQYDYENVEVYENNLLLPEQHDEFISADYNEDSDSLKLVFKNAQFPPVDKDYYVIGYSDNGYLIKISDFSKSGDTLKIYGQEDNLENVIKTGSIDSTIAMNIKDNKAASLHIVSDNYSVNADKQIIKKQDNFSIYYYDLSIVSNSDSILIDTLMLDFDRSMDFVCSYDNALTNFAIDISNADSIYMNEIYTSFDSRSAIDEEIIIDTIYYEPMVYMFENIPVVITPASHISINSILNSYPDEDAYITMQASLGTEGIQSISKSDGISSTTTTNGDANVFTDSLHSVENLNNTINITDNINYNAYNTHCGNIALINSVQNKAIKDFTNYIFTDTCSVHNILTSNLSFSSFSITPFNIADSLNVFSDTLATVIINSDNYVSVTLTWDTICDLDLEVIDPDNEKIDLHNTASASGGIYSGDDQDGYGPEQIYWPNMNAPEGTYKITIHHYEGNASANYSIDVNAYGQTTQYTGTINKDESIFIAEFTTGSKLPPAINFVTKYEPLFVK
ncbi:MAG: hypothetical protein SVK54_03170 [candidate division WOR-3 bacterium]|nr:hypothetical protein [candidate division WOR-3 bacterium]